MSDLGPVVLSTGLICSVGLSSDSACAAIRARVSAAADTRFRNAAGEWIRGHSVALEAPLGGIARLARMAAMAIEEALSGIPREQLRSIPVLFCLAETDRAGRPPSLDIDLPDLIMRELGAELHADSRVISAGKVAASVALQAAPSLLGRVPRLLVVAADSFLTWPVLRNLDAESRLLSDANSDGFLPGEAAAALLLGLTADGPGLRILGAGFEVESAKPGSGRPHRADGLTSAIKAALAQASCTMHDIDYRISGLSGEQYFFKEATLALLRTLRVRREQLDIWHPAEFIGETGAVAGVAAVVLAQSAAARGYAPGPRVMIQMTNDDGRCAAMILAQESGS